MVFNADGEDMNVEDENSEPEKDESTHIPQSNLADSNSEFKKSVSGPQKQSNISFTDFVFMTSTEEIIHENESSYVPPIDAETKARKSEEMNDHKVDGHSSNFGLPNPNISFNIGAANVNSASNIKKKTPSKHVHSKVSNSSNVSSQSKPSESGTGSSDNSFETATTAHSSASVPAPVAESTPFHGTTAANDKSNADPFGVLNSNRGVTSETTFPKETSSNSSPPTFSFSPSSTFFGGDDAPSWWTAEERPKSSRAAEKINPGKDKAKEKGKTAAGFKVKKISSFKLSGASKSAPAFLAKELNFDRTSSSSSSNNDDLDDDDDFERSDSDSPMMGEEEGGERVHSNPFVPNSNSFFDPFLRFDKRAPNAEKANRDSNKRPTSGDISNPSQNRSSSIDENLNLFQRPNSTSGSDSLRSNKKSATDTDKSGLTSGAINKALSRSEDNLNDLAESYSRQGKDCYISGQYEQSLNFFNKALQVGLKGWHGRAVVLGNRAATLIMLNR